MTIPESSQETQTIYSQDSQETIIKLCYFADRSDVDEEMEKYQQKIRYSERYSTETFEYRHVILPKQYYESYIPEIFKKRLLREDEWRHLGICQSPGWMHYLIHVPEPHIFLFRRELDDQIVKKKGISMDAEVDRRCSLRLAVSKKHKK